MTYWARGSVEIYLLNAEQVFNESQTVKGVERKLQTCLKVQGFLARALGTHVCRSFRDCRGVLISMFVSTNHNQPIHAASDKHMLTHVQSCDWEEDAQDYEVIWIIIFAISTITPLLNPQLRTILLYFQPCISIIVSTAKFRASMKFIEHHETTIFRLILGFGCVFSKSVLP